MLSPFIRLVVVLGLLSALGPFAIDMYLPALPAIGAALRTDLHGVQLSLAAFFITFAASQLVYGPASDIFGRKPPLMVGIVLFIAGSVGCALAPDIRWHIAFRALQGLGAGAPMAVPRAIVRDLHTGTKATRLTSLLMLVLSVSPILAPLAGSLLVSAFSWRAIFWSVSAIGAAGLLLALLALDETRPPADRAGSDVAGALRAFGRLLRHGRFMGLTAIGGFSIAGFLVYLANSSFVLINHYGLTPSQFSIAFGVNAVAFIGASQFTGWLTARHGLPRVVAVAALGHALTMGLLLGLQLAGFGSLPVLLVVLFIGFAFTGLVLPTSSVLALDDHGDIAGAASALLGTLQMVVGAAMVALMGSYADGTPRPMVAGIAAAGLCALLLTWITLRMPGQAAPTAASPAARPGGG